MRALRMIVGKCLLLAGLTVWSTTPASALITTPYAPPPAQAASPVTVTGYGFDGKRVTYVQIFNKSDKIVNLSTWRLEYQPIGNDYTLLAQLDGLLRPLSYVVAANGDFLPGADFPYSPSDSAAPAAASLRLLPSPEYKPEDIKLPTKQELSFWRRNISDSTGNYLSTFSSFIPGLGDAIFGGGLYEIPVETGLQVSEILAHPKDCSPIDISLDCRDYVKLFNSTTMPIDLSAFRLRSGFQGQSATSSNTFMLKGVIQPGRYATVTIAADDSPLSLTNSGGYVWLEDMYGVKIYEMTVQEYPDASSDRRKGQAWAYDGLDGAWEWTTRPTPDDAPSIFPVEVKEVTAVETSVTPCQPNQYRNPETNRCRLIDSPEIATLMSCAPGQYRNSETNRCRSLATVASLTPCGEGEERNRETNRCRRIASTQSSLAPCQPSQERNPDTNRCRNKTIAALSAETPFPVEPVGQSTTSFVGWWVLGGVVLAAFCYGVWEWHHEIYAMIRRATRYLLPFK